MTENLDTRDDLVDRIANEFTTRLIELLGTMQMAEVVKRNKAEGAGSKICHSHDFCDANMVMAAAWEEEMLRPIDIDSVPDTAILNEAWDLAKLRFESAVSAIERR